MPRFSLMLIVKALKLIRVILVKAKSLTGKKITFSAGMYMWVNDDNVRLISTGFGVGGIAADISFNEARQLFQSIERAIDLECLEEITLRDLNWITDARIKSKWPDWMIILVRSPSGSLRASLPRNLVIAAVKQFEEVPTASKDLAIKS